MTWKETCVMDGRMEMIVRIKHGESVSAAEFDALSVLSSLFERED